MISNVLKASLFNLVLASKTEEEKQLAKKLALKITERYPCRVFFVHVDESVSFDVLESTKTIGQKSAPVSFDETTITTNEENLTRAPFVIWQKLLPDLPLYLYLGHTLDSADPFIRAIKSFASRIIFDSTNCHSFDSLTHDHHIIDLNWGADKKRGEKSLPISFLKKENFSVLEKTNAITVGVNSPTSTIQPLYLQAWLASVLGWTVKKSDKNQITYDACNVTIKPEEVSGLQKNEISSLQIKTSKEHVIEITHTGKANQVLVHTTCQDRCEMPYELFLNNYQSGSALVNELLYNIPSGHYEKMLSTLSHIKL